MDSAPSKWEDYWKLGYVHYAGLMAGTPELRAMQERVFSTVALRAKLAGQPIPTPTARESADPALLGLYQQDRRHVSFVYDVLRYSPELGSLVNAPRVLDEVARVFRTERRHVVTNNHNLRVDLPGEDWTEALPWHQDWPYNNPLYMFNNSLASWIALFDVPAENGAMVVKRGSQAVGEIQHEKVLHKGKAERQDPYVYQVPDAISRDPAYPEVQMVARAGDVILFDLTLVHRSGINKLPDRIRWSAQARYHSAAHPGFLPKYAPGSPP